MSNKSKISVFSAFAASVTLAGTALLASPVLAGDHAYEASTTTQISLVGVKNSDSDEHRSQADDSHDMDKHANVYTDSRTNGLVATRGRSNDEDHARDESHDSHEDRS